MFSPHPQNNSLTGKKKKWLFLMKKSCCKRTHKTTTVQFVQLEKVSRHPNPWDSLLHTHTHTHTHTHFKFTLYIWKLMGFLQKTTTQLNPNLEWYMIAELLPFELLKLWLLVLLVAVVLVVSIGVLLFLSELLCWSVWWFFWCFLC